MSSGAGGAMWAVDVSGTGEVRAAVSVSGTGGGVSSVIKVDVCGLLGEMDDHTLIAATGVMWDLALRQDLSAQAWRWAQETHRFTDATLDAALDLAGPKGARIGLTVKIDQDDAARWLLAHRYAVAVALIARGPHEYMKRLGVAARRLGIDYPGLGGVGEREAIALATRDAEQVHAVWSAQGGVDWTVLVVLSALAFGDGARTGAAWSAGVGEARGRLYALAGVEAVEAREIERKGQISDEQLAVLGSLRPVG